VTGPEGRAGRGRRRINELIVIVSTSVRTAKMEILLFEISMDLCKLI
jgi:hypothetical protein